MGEAKSHQADGWMRTPPHCISLTQPLGPPKPGILGQPEMGAWRWVTKASWGCLQLVEGWRWRCDLLHVDASGRLAVGIKLPSWHLSGKEAEEEFGFYFSSTQVQLGKASAFRTPNSISLCKVFFCKIDNFLRLKESQRNFTVKLQKSTAISLLCPNGSSGFTF